MECEERFGLGSEIKAHHDAESKFYCKECREDTKIPQFKNKPLALCNPKPQNKIAAQKKLLNQRVINKKRSLNRTQPTYKEKQFEVASYVYSENLNYQTLDKLLKNCKMLFFCTDFQSTNA